MPGELILPNRVGWDIDDTVLWSEQITRLGSALWGQYVNKYTPGKYVLDNIPVLDHTPIPKEGVKSWNYYWHMQRRPIPGIPQRIDEGALKGDENVFVTGRPATRQWDISTRSQLRVFGVKPHALVLTPVVRPEGYDRDVSTNESKADGIRAWGISRFYDNDGRTILYLSEMFPDRQFNWIRHTVQNVSAFYQDMMRERPNVEIIDIRDWATQPELFSAYDAENFEIAD